MKKHNYIIRFDDLCPTMDYQQWNKALSILREYNIKPLIDVIPECKDPELLIEKYHTEFWDEVKQLQIEGFEIAMHGCYHLYDIEHKGLVNPGTKSEFAGHPYHIQLEKIKIGKEILNNHGIYTDVFFAPSHSYDNNTLKALRDCGFKYISDGKSRKNYIKYGITCIPCRYSGIKELFFNKNQILVFHPHEWVRKNKEKGYIQLKEICKNKHQDIVTFKQLKEEKVGNLLIQLTIEKTFIAWEKIYPRVARIIKNII